MADNEEINLDGDGSSAPVKKGRAGGFFPGLLKWIIIALAAIILVGSIVIVAVVLINKGKTTPVATSYSVEYDTAITEELDWYQSIATIQTFSNDTIPATIRVTVFLGYKADDKATSAEISKKSVLIKDFLRQYFSGKTAQEVKDVSNENRLKIEIKNGINDKILRTSKIKAVVFDQKDVLEQ